MTRQFDIETAITIPAMPALLAYDLYPDLAEATAFTAVPTDDEITAPHQLHDLRALASAPIAWRIAVAARPTATAWACTCAAPVEHDARCLDCGGGR